MSVVQARCDHPTADQIYEAARCQMPNISMGTVYRNLGKLADEGRIRKIAVPGGPDRFDKTLYAHGHLICVRCGGVVDCPPPDIDSIEKELGVKLLSYEFTARYLCPNCTTSDM